MHKKATHIKIESPGVNVAVVRNTYDGWEYLLLQRAEQETYSGSWGFMTGGKQGDETVAQVAVRELYEETQLAPKSLWATEHLVQFYEPEYDSIWILPLIVAVVDETAEVILSEENCEFRWLKSTRAKHKVSWKNLSTAIDNISEELEIFPARNWVQIHA